MVELYDFNNGNNKYHIWSFYNFFHLDENDYFLFFKYELFDLKEKSEYIIAFIPLFKVDENLHNISFIKKFIFKSFDDDTYHEICSINYADFLNKKIINIFLLEQSKVLAILTINEILVEDELSEDQELLEYDKPPIPIYRTDESKKENYQEYPIYKFTLKFYDQKLKSLLSTTEVILINDIFYYHLGEDLFIKSLYLNDLNEQFVIFLYYIDEYSYLAFDLFEINILDYTSKKNIINPKKSGALKHSINFDIRKSTNDFIKINSEKVAFMYMTQIKDNQLVILIINVNQLNDKLNPIEFSIDLDNYYPTQIKGLGYNGYLLFSATGQLENTFYYSNENNNNYLSIFMAFGYANGTDLTIDITKFLNKEGPEEKINFIDFLFQNLKIENNIFGYIPLSVIKLVSIPKEISISQYNFATDEEINISEENFFKNPFPESPNSNYVPNGPFISSNCILAKYFNDEESESCLDFDYIIRENISLIKTSQYYYIDYQNFLRDFYLEKEEGEGIHIPQGRRLDEKRDVDFYEVYPGRINRIKFKLCHQYCETCFELNTFDNVQKCVSCLPKYQYNYFYFSNIGEENQKNICVPERYYYDINEKGLSKCNKQNKYYVNNTDNKRICFQNEDDYPCPSSYPVFDKVIYKCYNKSELYLDEMIRNFQEYIINGINRTSIDNGDDFIVSIEEMTYALTSTKNQINQIRDNITTIDLGECENKLKHEYNISKNDSLYILKVDRIVDNMQKIEYEVYYNFSSNNLTKLNLTVCKDIKIDILIPKDIPANEIDKYNKDSGFYNDICYTFTTGAGTDISLNDRRNEYKKNSLHICEDNCDYTGYNENLKKVKCSCFTKLNLPLFSEIKVDKQKLLSNFKDIRNIGNFKMLSCIKLFFNKNNILKNISNYMFVILFILSIISVCIFSFYDYKKINEFICSNEEKIVNNELSQNIMETNNENKQNMNNNQNSAINKNKITKKIIK